MSQRVAAGKPDEGFLFYAEIRVHPVQCGDHGADGTREVAQLGSSEPGRRAEILLWSRLVAVECRREGVRDAAAEDDRLRIA